MPRPKSIIHCEYCGTPIKLARTGRPPRFCSTSCRTASFNKIGRDLSAADRQRAVMWQLLQDANLVPRDRPLPARQPEGAAR